MPKCFWVGDAVFADAAIQLVAGIDLGTGQGRADGQTPAACRMAQHNLIFSAVKQEGMVHTAAQSKLFILACKHIADACGGMKIKRRTLGIAEFPPVGRPLASMQAYVSLCTCKVWLQISSWPPERLK